jgi:predicted component of type VI protein secretion system
MSDGVRAVSRRTVGKMLLAVPAAALAADEKKEDEKPSAHAELISSTEPGLSPEERERLKKAVGDVEKALAVVRDFKLPMDVTPALKFRALKSRRS